jgi:hypothetical protein
MPEKEPLHELILLEFVLETEMLVLIEPVQEVEQLCRRLEDGMRRRASVVDDDGDTT